MTTPNPMDLAAEDVQMDGSFFEAHPGEDAWLESLLRQDAARQPYVEDGGFSHRVLGALPVPRKPVSHWVVPSMGVLGAGIAIGATPACNYFTRNFFGLFDVHHLSAANLWVLVPIAVMYACTFAAVRQP